MTGLPRYRLSNTGKDPLMGDGGLDRFRCVCAGPSQGQRWNLAIATHPSLVLRLIVCMVGR